MEALITFEGLKFFSLWGLIVCIIIILPNFTFAKKGQATKLDDIDTASTKICFLEVFSRLGLTVCLIALRFPVRFDAFGICALISLVIYFALWVKFFKDGSYYPDIYLKSFIGIPVPFDTFIVIYFIFASLWLSNIIALGFSLVYAVCRMINAHVAMRDLKSRL